MLQAYPSMLACAALALMATDDAAGSGAPSGELAAPAKGPAKAKASAPTEAAAKKVKMVAAVVRRGTVVVGDHGSEKHVGPGGTVTLPEVDVIALRKRGVLVDPDNAPEVASGPKLENPE